MAGSAPDLDREYTYLRQRKGGDFFLALAPYVNTLHGKRLVHQVLRALERETEVALTDFIDQETVFIEEAKRIREELAARAPEIDDSDMERPNHLSEMRVRYDFDSFANLDRLAVADLDIGYPVLPRDGDDPGPVSRLLIILRGRLRAAEYGEDAPGNASKLRDDLEDVGRRIGNLQSRHDAALQSYSQKSRTLPGLAYGRLARFASELVPEPVVFENDEDVDMWLDQTIRELGSPTAVVRKLVNGESLDQWETNTAQETEEALKDELDRLHQELSRRLGPSFIDRFGRNPWIVGIVVTATGTVIAGLILALVAK